MALSADTIWEVRQDGSDTNGGGYVSTGTDYSQQAAAQLSVTDAACSGTTTLTSATGGFTTAMIGNVLYLSSGPGWYQITARTDTNTVTLDRAGPSASGMTCNVGGALATPGRAAGCAIASNHVYIKYNASPYLITTSSSNIAAGIVVSSVGGTEAKPFRWIGYDSTRSIYNTDANRPTIKLSSVSSVTMLAFSGTNTTVYNLIADADNNATTKCFTQTGNYGVTFYNCKAMKFRTYGFDMAGASGANYGTIIFCEASQGGTGAAGGFYSCINPTFCIAKDNTGAGFYQCIAPYFCIADTNTGIGFSMLQFGGAKPVNCIAYNNGGSGFDFGSYGYSSFALNCVSYGSTGGYGFTASAVLRGPYLLNCFAGSNSSSNTNGTNLPSASVTNLSANPFTDGDNGDFSLHSTNGAALKATALPALIPGGLTANYLDANAVQHQDSGGGGGTTFFIPVE